MSAHTVSVLSTEYVKVPVAARAAGAPIDVSQDVVQVAFTTAGAEPVDGDWKTASWEQAGSTLYARCLIGPAGDVQLPAGTYDQWVKVTDSPEVPVKKATNQLAIV